jgi:hypothetical protein
VDPETQVIAVVDRAIAEVWSANIEYANYEASLRRPPAPTALELVEQTRQAARTEAYNAERRRLDLAERQRRWRRAERQRAVMNRRTHRLLAAGVPGHSVWFLAHAGFRTVDALRRATDAELLAVPGIGRWRVRRLREFLAATAPPPPDWLAEE